MAGYSARQSSYSDGDTITAAHTNDEFNAILAAFNVSTGHTHDGSTAGDGGPISKLFSNAITFGTGADTDIAVTFDGNTSDGVLTWMEDEDYFQFSDDILLSTTPEAKSATSRLVILFPLPFASIVLFVNVSVLEPVTTVPSILIVKVFPEPTVSIPVPPATVKVSVSKSIFNAPPESP